MEQRQFLEGIQLISKFFGSPWPSEAVATAYDSVKDMPIGAIHATHKRVYVEFPPRPLPAIGRIVEVIKQEAVKINLANSPAEAKSRRENDAQPVINKHGIGQIGIDSLKLIDALFDGKLSRENFIEGVMIFDKKYPHIGWGEQAASLAAYYSLQDRVEHFTDMS